MFKNDKVNFTGSRVISFVGARGGCGTTTIALNTAMAMAKSGKYVLYIDGNIDNPSAFLYFDIDADSINTQLTKSLRQEVILNNLTIPTNNKRIKLISESPIVGYSMLGETNHTNTLQLIDKAADNFDIVIIDCPSHYSEEFTIAGIEKSSEVIMITDSDNVSMLSMNKMKHFIKNLTGTDKLKSVIVNKATTRTYSRESLENFGMNLLFTQYYSQSAYEIGNKQKIFCDSGLKKGDKELQEFKANINSLVGYICNK